ncbi:MAG: E3 ubiquitin ligase family protein [Candidatus Kapaibacterium sp.]
MITAIVIGAILSGIGALLLFLKGKSEDKLLEVKVTQTSQATELTELQQAVASEIGPGGFSQLAEVKGVGESEKPLTGELSNQPCLWYSMRVEELYEETYTETDANGNSVTRTRTGSNNVANNTQSIPFSLRDESGSIMVYPEGAKIEGRKVVDRHEPAQNGLGTISFGSFSMSLTPNHGRRITGYRYHEEILPVGERLYIIGDANDRDGGILAFRKPLEKGKPFIVSIRSEEEIAKGLETSAKVKQWIGFGLIGVGSGLVFAAIAGAFG